MKLQSVQLAATCCNSDKSKSCAPTRIIHNKVVSFHTTSRTIYAIQKDVSQFSARLSQYIGKEEEEQQVGRRKPGQDQPIGVCIITSFMQLEVETESWDVVLATGELTTAVLQLIWVIDCNVFGKNRGYRWEKEREVIPLFIVWLILCWVRLLYDLKN